MKPLSIIILFLTLFKPAAAQVITGKVMRMGSNGVIANASVYFSGSEKGTSTDSLGKFTVRTTQSQVPLIVSCVGYYSATLTHYSPDTLLMVYLKPKENVMREVQIGGDGMSHTEKLRIFKREFLGTSEYALSCTIANINDIDLHYDKETGKLTAFCSNPIIIKNKLLGYTLTYYLDNFTRTTAHIGYAGNYLFKDDSLLNKKEIKKVKAAREDAYSDSRMHFIRALWGRRLDRDGFAVYDNVYQKITDQDILSVNKRDEKFLIMKTPIRITYKSDFHSITYISQKEPFSYIDEHGYHGSGLTWSGAMGRQRIGDMLPFEYVSKQDPVIKPATTKP